jgi:hypothetical protein
MILRFFISEVPCLFGIGKLRLVCPRRSQDSQSDESRHCQGAPVMKPVSEGFGLIEDSIALFWSAVSGEQERSQPTNSR